MAFKTDFGCLTRTTLNYFSVSTAHFISFQDVLPSLFSYFSLFLTPTWIAREWGESSYSIKKKQSFLLHFFCYHLLHLHIQTQQHKETSPWTGATLLQNVLVENNYVELILCIILSFSRKTPVYWCSQSPESYGHYFMWVMFSVCRILCYPSFKCFVSNRSPNCPFKIYFPSSGKSILLGPTVCCVFPRQSLFPLQFQQYFGWLWQFKTHLTFPKLHTIRKQLSAWFSKYFQRKERHSLPALSFLILMSLKLID